MVRGVSAAIVALLGGAAFGVPEAHAGSLYDMSAMLAEPYPLAAGAWFAGAGTPAPALAGLMIQPANPAAGSPSAPAMMTASGGGSATTLANAGTSEGGGGFVSELRGGVLLHDFGPFSHRKEESVDANLEVLFASPDFLDVIWSPRPHLGANVNTAGDTSQVYFGLSYQWTFWDDFFGGFSLGGAVHDGETDQAGHDDRKELGGRVLFRESVELGWHVAGHHNVSLMLDHISNAKLCDTNEGLENFGVRYGYVF